jgi:hypothetical protein
MAPLIDDATKAYMAGTIDLIGLIRLRDAPKGPLPVVQMHGPHFQVMSLFSETTDTKVITTSRGFTKAGCSQHCSDKHIHVKSISARWSVTGARATVLLWNLLPYLRTKKVIAGVVMEAGINAGYKPATVRKMQELGWEIPTVERRAAS